MGNALRPASLNGIQFDAIISRETSYTADVPEYPVEDGFMVSDAILTKPIERDSLYNRYAGHLEKSARNIKGQIPKSHKAA